MIRKKILAVAGPQWQSALLNAASDLDNAELAPLIASHDAAEAVELLATQPAAFSALALEAAAGGPWLTTLLDLTLGDSDKPVPLLMLGKDHAGFQYRLSNTASLHLPVDKYSLHDALNRAYAQNSKSARKNLPVKFPDIESIRVRYQPLVRLEDLLPVSVEVLARVLIKDGRMIGPEYIIAAMTNSENAMKITRFIVQLALNENNEGQFNELGLNFAFNLPLDAMMHPDLISIIETMRSKTSMPPKALGFELTESQPVTDFARTEIIITALRVAGYRLALDDITPETPDLEALMRLPFRGIKLDRSVIVGATGKNPDFAQYNRDFINKISIRAQLRRQAVVAEGIESMETLELMRDLGVTHGQGYFFARPLPARALKPWLHRWMTERESKSRIVN